LVAEDGGWRPLSLPAPVERAGLVGSGGFRLVGGRSLRRTGPDMDGGTSWALAWIDQVSELITCFAVSPRYGRDLTLLAGTAGAGILRSSGGGRRWQLSNFGLEEFTILALATAGDWSRRQVVFAGTADGVYRSSGGGRAWKAVGLRGLTVQCLAGRPRRPPLGAGRRLSRRCDAGCLGRLDDPGWHGVRRSSIGEGRRIHMGTVRAGDWRRDGDQRAALRGSGG